MAKDITLLVLAAGMGSRYGGLKQLDPLGPNGETILEYSIYDAIQAGFTKVVFVIRDFFEEEFKEKVSARFQGKIDIAYVHQPVNPVIAGVEDVPKREKPWGTSHAVLVGKPEIREPFAVINADDYYGQSCFHMMGDFLREKVRPDLYAMVGYILKNTLSDQGHVNRGVCKTDENDNLIAVEEILKITRVDGQIVYGENQEGELEEDAIVSMNFWGFHPNMFEHLETGFRKFVEAHKDDPKAEYFIPLIVDDLIRSGQVKVNVLTSLDQWYGVTYKEDAERVRSAFRSFSSEGKYPYPLW